MLDSRGGPKERYPLGIKPRWVHDEERLAEIQRAIGRYQATGNPVPAEWIEENNELFARLNARKETQRVSTAEPEGMNHMRLIEVQDGDTLVFNTPHEISDKAFERFKEHMNEWKEGTGLDIKMLCLTAMDISVIRTTVKNS